MKQEKIENVRYCSNKNWRSENTLAHCKVHNYFALSSKSFDADWQIRYWFNVASIDNWLTVLNARQNQIISVIHTKTNEHELVKVRTLCTLFGARCQHIFDVNFYLSDVARFVCVVFSMRVFSYKSIFSLVDSFASLVFIPHRERRCCFPFIHFNVYYSFFSFTLVM